MKDSMMITLSGTPWGTLEMFVKVDDVIDIVEEIKRRHSNKYLEEKSEENKFLIDDLERYVQNTHFNSNSAEDMYIKKIYQNAIWVCSRLLFKDNIPSNYRLEEWGEVVFEFRYDNIYCEVVIGKDNFYLMRKPHRKGNLNPMMFDYTDSCTEVLNDELNKCKKLC